MNESKKIFTVIRGLGIVVLIFSLYAIFFGIRFFPHSWLQIYYRIAQALILISGIIYSLSGIFLVMLRKWARKLTIISSGILVAYLIPLSAVIILDPSGWGGFIVFSFSPFILLPVCFIILLNHKKIKEQFK